MDEQSTDQANWRAQGDGQQRSGGCQGNDHGDKETPTDHQSIDWVARAQRHIQRTNTLEILA